MTEKRVEIAPEAARGLAEIAFWGLVFGGPIFAAMMLPVAINILRPPNFHKPNEE